MNKNILELLQSSEDLSQYAGLDQLRDEMETIDANIMELFLKFLISPNPDIRYSAIKRLREAASMGRDISSMLPSLQQLYADKNFPSHLLNWKNEYFSIGGEAVTTTALYYYKQGQVSELETLAALSPFIGSVAIHALSGFNTLSEIEPFTPFLHKMLNGDRIRERASFVLTKIYWLNHDWEQIKQLINHVCEDVRLGAIAMLDNFAEAEQDIEPLLSSLVEIFEHREPDFDETRRAVANIFIWFGPRKKGKPLIIAGVDVLQIPEVQAEFKNLEQFIRKARRGR